MNSTNAIVTLHNIYYISCNKIFTFNNYITLTHIIILILHVSALLS